MLETWFHVPRSLFLWTAAIAATIGVTYALSPLTVWCALLITLLLGWATRGLAGMERRWVVTLLVVAIVARVAAIAAIFLLADHDRQPFASIFGDEAHITTTSLLLRNVGLDVPMSPSQFFAAFDEYGRSGFAYFLAAIQVVTGRSPYGIRLLNMTLFLFGAVVLFRTVRSAYGPEAALCGLALLLALPSLFIWSISALKEPSYFLLNAIIISAIFEAVRATRWRVRLLLMLAMLASLAAIATLRSGTIGVALANLGGAAAGLLYRQRPRLVLVVGVVCVLAAFPVLTSSRVSAVVMEQLQRGARYHWGSQATPGHGYKLLDARFYDEHGEQGLPEMTPPEAVRFVTRALISFVIVPLPWQIVSMSEIVFLPQQIIWYVLVVLAVVGCVAALRRNTLLTSILGANAVVGIFLISLTNGNVGTLIRMRDMVVPMLLWWSGLGICVTVERLAGHRRQVAPPARYSWRGQATS